MSYLQVYEQVSQYMDYYNNRYRHGSLDDRSPIDFYEDLMVEKIIPKPFIA